MRKQKMESRSTNERSSRKSESYAGTGLAIGAAIGMVFGLMLFEELVWGCMIGAGLGLVIGAAIDAHVRHRADSDE